MRRREFIGLVGGAAVSPVVARAQLAKLPVVGYLHSGSPDGSASAVAAFRKGLSETGYVEGRNVAIEYRWANNENDRLPELAADLVRRRVAVIATQTNLAARAAKASTVVIPIVFNTSTDPVQTGLVASLNRPGGNVTGVTYVGTDIEGKQLGLLHELLPGAVRFAVLVNPAALIVAESTIQGLQLAASTIGRQIEILSASTSREIETAVASLPQKGADALVVAPSTLFLGRRVQLTTLVAQRMVPAIYYAREFTQVGGLMSYGTNFAEVYRQAGRAAAVSRCAPSAAASTQPSNRPLAESANPWEHRHGVDGLATKYWLYMLDD